MVYRDNEIPAFLRLAALYFKINARLQNSKRANRFVVRLTGLEPAQPKLLDPKSSASTSSATGA